MQRIGVLDLEAFYPADKRFELAMAVNNLLASPGFSAWMEGEPLDVQRLLYTPEGKPRVSILSIAHLNDAERMFFVSLLLNQVLGWMRQQPGTTSLRAIVYMDEIAGYLPPVANPASKAPMLTLLKQARAFGVGMVLATQNPVDLDYKALSNAGTWFIGRLQTERDQARVLDGLEGAMSTAGRAFDRAAMQRLIGGLGKRVFLLHNVHEDGPEVFESRWAMSYLRGPLTRTQIRTLMADRKANCRRPRPQDAAPHEAPRQHGTGRGTSTHRRHEAVPRSLSPDPAAWHRTVLRPGQPGRALRADDRRLPRTSGSRTARPRLTRSRQLTVVTPLTSDPIPVGWDRRRAGAIRGQPAVDGTAAGRDFEALPAAAGKAKSYADWTKSFSSWVASSETLDLYRSPSLGLISAADESEGDFRARLQQAARERRDAEVARLRQKYAPKLASLQEKLRRALQSVAREEEQASAQKTQTAISFGTTVLGALFGRKTLSASTLGRATTAVRGVGRSSKEAQDVARAKENVDSVQGQLEEMDTTLNADIAALEATYHPATEPLETISLKPKRGGVTVQLVALVWVG